MRDREQYADFQARMVCLKLWGNLLESRSSTPSPSLSACGGQRQTLYIFLSHSPPKTGTSPKPGAHQSARLATSEPRICLLPLQLWSIFL